MKNIINIFFVLITINGFAQINIGGKPYSLTSIDKLEKQIPILTTKPIDFIKLNEEDKQDELNNVPPRFGYKHLVNIDIEKDGIWTTLPNGDKLWQLEIHCPSAKSINFTFDKFWLPENSVLYVYNKSKTHIIGGFTDKNNKSINRNEPRGFATGLVYGEIVIIEYYQQRGKEISPVISINGIVHGYRHINTFWETKSTDDFGESGSCQIDINCSDGDNWQDEKKGVAMVVVSGDRYCTGSLINNTCNDGTLYFLTADHCTGGWANDPKNDAVNNPNADDWSFYWNYESPECNSSTTNEPPIYATSGATVIANNGSTDFALLKLDESPLDLQMPLGVVFNGWNVTNSVGSGGAGIHHPQGDVKKISLYTQTPLGDYTYCNYPNIIDNKYWYVVFEHPSGHFSATEGGSSGSPLFDSNSRIIGQLRGGALLGFCTSGPTCFDPSQDMSFYGKISKSWNQNIINKRQLKHWLDPCDTGEEVLDGIEWDCVDAITINQPLYYAPPIFTSLQFSVNQSIVANSEINAPLFVDFLAGNNILLQSGFHIKEGVDFLARIEPCEAEEFMPIASKKNLNIVEEKENIQKEEAQVQISEFKVFPNPAKNTVNIVYESSIEENILVEIIDINSKKLFQGNFLVVEGRNELRNIKLDNFIDGLYFVSLKSKEQYLFEKLIIKK